MLEINNLKVETDNKEILRGINLKIDNKEITKRHEKTIEEGANHGYTTYQAHITLKYSGTDLDISKLIKPDFDILLGNETTVPLNLDWKDSVE